MLPPNTVETPPDAIVIALQFWQGDSDRAMRLARLIAAIEPRRRDDVVFAFCRRFDVPLTADIYQTSLKVGLRFPILHIQSKREATGHPDGAFGLWAGTMDALSEAWAAGHLRAHSVFTLEADGVPLRADWLDILIEAHARTLAAGKRITGPEMNALPHVNGSLVAHLSLWQDRQSLHRCPPGQAWDLFHAEVLQAETRPSGWLRNVYGACDWSLASLRAMSKETAWLCSQKDDSALEWAEGTLPRRVRQAGPVRHYATACKADQIGPLVRSMERHCGEFRLHVLAWDWDPGLGRHPNTVMTGRDQLLARHPGLTHLPGAPRNTNETVCSSRWTFFCDVMADTSQPVTAIDGDVMFFSSPEPVFEEIGDAPCAVTPHNFAPAALGLPGIAHETHAQHGIHNGGFCYLADRSAAEYMAKRAREWCYIDFRVENGRRYFGDQTYLEELVERFGAHVIQHTGINLGPWGIHREPLEERDGVLHFGDRPLVSYHFSSLRWNPDGSLAHLFNPEYAVTAEQQRLLYDPYLKEICRG